MDPSCDFVVQYLAKSQSDLQLPPVPMPQQLAPQTVHPEIKINQPQHIFNRNNSRRKRIKKTTQNLQRGPKQHKAQNQIQDPAVQGSAKGRTVLFSSSLPQC